MAGSPNSQVQDIIERMRRNHRNIRKARARTWICWSLLGGIVLAAVLARPLLRSLYVQSPATSADRGEGQGGHQPADSTTEAGLSTTNTTWDELDDPTSDGWETEAFSDLAASQLRRLAELVTGDTAPDAAALRPLLADSFSCGNLVPDDVEETFHDHLFLVERSGRRGESEQGQDPSPFTGADGLADALGQLTKQLRGGQDLHAKFKLFRLQRTDDGIVTEQYFSLSARNERGMVEQHATWTIRWQISADGSPPKIRWIGVSEFERTTSNTNTGPLFVDCTPSVLAENACYETQLLRGYHHWLRRVPFGSYMEVTGTPGLAVGDVNGDGLDDLYLCQERGLPNCLFLQNSDGSATEVSAAWQVDWLEHSRGALLLDFDNDGDQDLAVAVSGGIVVAENEGHRFRMRLLLPTTLDTMHLCAADYDRDGDVDLYVCVYRHVTEELVEFAETSGPTVSLADTNFVLHDGKNSGGANVLFRNDIATTDDGVWQFTDVTDETGLEENNRRSSYSASWEDYDNDGDQDLYVANDFGRDCLYLNDGGHFTDISETANIEDAGSGMGICWGDYNRDGWMDAYVSNMFSAAGNRITFQPEFKIDASAEVRRRLQRMVRGNTLLANRGDGSFEDVSDPAGVEMGRWAWASRMIDINNDGWKDILTVNGNFTTPEAGDL